MRTQDRTAPTLLICDGSSVVGRALELLLQSLGYRARFETLPVDASARPLVGVQLLLLAPELAPARREKLLRRARDLARDTAIPVLELIAAGRAPTTPGHQVRWPCQADELGREIDRALAADCRDAKPPNRAAAALSLQAAPRPDSLDTPLAC